jgi:hypothetical protein
VIVPSYLGQEKHICQVGDEVMVFPKTGAFVPDGFFRDGGVVGVKSRSRLNA